MFNKVGRREQQPDKKKKQKKKNKTLSFGWNLFGQVGSSYNEVEHNRRNKWSDEVPTGRTCLLRRLFFTLIERWVLFLRRSSALFTEMLTKLCPFTSIICRRECEQTPQGRTDFNLMATRGPPKHRRQTWHVFAECNIKSMSLGDRSQRLWINVNEAPPNQWGIVKQ